MADTATVSTSNTPAAQPTITLVGGHAPRPQSTTKPLADTPFALINDTGASDPSNAHIPPEHYCLEMAYTMAQIHNTILRGINSIYNQALDIKAGTKEAEDFIYWNQCVYHFLHHHHMNEEETFFPLLKEVTGDPKFCDTETKEHDEFDIGAKKWKEYIYNVRSEDYDGIKLRSLLDDFGPLLHQHLVAEIPWLLTLHKYDSEACKKAMLTTGKKAEAETSLTK